MLPALVHVLLRTDTAVGSHFTCQLECPLSLFVACCLSGYSFITGCIKHRGGVLYAGLIYGRLCRFYGNLCQIILWSFLGTVVLIIATQWWLFFFLCLHGLSSCSHVCHSPVGPLFVTGDNKAKTRDWAVWHIWIFCMKFSVCQSKEENMENFSLCWAQLYIRKRIRKYRGQTK